MAAGGIEEPCERDPKIPDRMGRRRDSIIPSAAMIRLEVTHIRSPGAELPDLRRFLRDKFNLEFDLLQCK
jgi:hypothetical protein